jgi:hypothetical protein
VSYTDRHKKRVPEPGVYLKIPIFHRLLVESYTFLKYLSITSYRTSYRKESSPARGKYPLRPNSPLPPAKLNPSQRESNKEYWLKARMASGLIFFGERPHAFGGVMQNQETL